MRDWKRYVRERLFLSDLDERDEFDVVDEVATQLEDCYLEALSRGASREDAEARAP